MDIFDLLGDAGRIALRTFIVAAPLLAWQFIVLWARPLRRRSGGLADPTVIGGMMVGVAILAVILPAEALTWDSVIMVGGYWDMGLWQFMDLAHGMVVNGPVALLTVLAVDDARRDLQAWLALAMTLWLVRAIAVWLSGAPLGGSRLLLGEVATFVASIIGTVYLGPLLLWSLNRLNFWLLLIVLLLIQDYRYDEPPLFGRLVGAVNGVRHRQRAVATEAMPMSESD
ncbi:MAG: hypothetical protein WA864_00750 [Acetobacteraceae bacterium]|jgi:hypothetical protein